jgi:hypothetical protein
MKWAQTSQLDTVGKRLAQITRTAQRRDPMTARKKDDAGPKLLSGGNPQIPKGDGDGPVRDYIAAMPGWKRNVGGRLDDLIVRTVPDVHKAVKWNQPFCFEGEGWFLAFRCYTKYVTLQFFRGTSLDPVPPKPSKHIEVRYLDIHEHDDLDEDQLRSWIEQASNLPGEKM